MTEAKWLACRSPKLMLNYLKKQASDRKLRLFAVACCGPIAEWIDDPRGRVAVAVAEGYADGEATEEQREAATQEARSANARFLNRRTRPALGDAARQEAGSAAAATTITHALLAAGRASEYGLAAARRAGVKGMSDRQTDLLRDLFGNPFRPPPPLPLSLLTWQEGLVRRLAEEAYEKRIMLAGTLDPARLAVLADALEEAGADAELVEHLRGPGPHTRGCWAVDLVLGRE